MVNPHLHGATGRMLGRLETCAAGRMTFVTREALRRGDRVRVQPASDRPGTGFTIRELSLGQRPVTHAAAGARVTVGTPPDATFRKGDMVFQVASGETATVSEAACRKRLAAARSAPARIDLAIAFPDGRGHRADGQGGRSGPDAPLPADLLSRQRTAALGDEPGTRSSGAAANFRWR